MDLESGYQVIGKMPHFSQEALREERNVFWVSCDEAAEIGGPVTRAFIEQLPADWRADPAVGIRTKLAWLRRGWYPSSSLCGWHCDMVSARSDGQGQDYAGADEATLNCQTIFAVMGDISLTEFAHGRFTLPDYPAGQPQRILLSRRIESLIAAGTLERRQVCAEDMIQMGFAAFHRVAPAHQEGWRMFMRAVRGWHKPKMGDDLWTTMKNSYRPESEAEIMAFQPYERSTY